MNTEQRQLTWPSVEEQQAYWENMTDQQAVNLLRMGLEDHGGNVIPDRIQANEWLYSDYENALSEAQMEARHEAEGEHEQ